MYNKVCPEIFGESRRAFEGLERTKLPEDVRNFITDYLNLNSDMDWVLVALAKAKTRQPELIATVKEKYAKITEQETIFDWTPLVTEHIPMYYMFCYTTYLSTKHYIDMCIEHFDEKNNLFHPLGYLHYYSGIIRIGYDFLSFATRDADERVDLMLPLYEKALEEVVLPLALQEHEALTKFRMEAFEQVDTFSSTLDDLFESSMSVREFKDKMSHLATVNIIDGLTTNASTIDEVIELLAQATGGRISRRQGSSDNLPKDIDGMFDDQR